MNKYQITIITPTYNRANTLPHLYESLLKQTDKSFLWLIIDDGSSDGTETLAESWKAEKKIPIEYKYQENGGKHRALNMGISMIDTELTFIVDSDDWLPENSIEVILRYHHKYKNYSGLCGYSFLRFYSDGKVNEAFFPENEKVSTYVEERINGGIGGDKAEVFYTDILKKFPFPVFGEEKFVPEDLIWVQMSGPYQMVHINECVYISDYLEGGLTKSGKRMKIHSPRAMVKRSEIYLNNKRVNGKTKIKMSILYVIYGSFAGMRCNDLKKELLNKIWLYLAWMPGKIIYRIWRKKYA